MAESHPKFDVSLVTPDGPAFDGEAEMVVVPGAAGEIGVLARHAPLVATLEGGLDAGSSQPERGARVRDRAGLLQGRARSRARARGRRRQREGDRRRAGTRTARGREGRAREGRGGRVAGRPLAARAAHHPRREPALGLRAEPPASRCASPRCRRPRKRAGARGRARGGRAGGARPRGLLRRPHLGLAPAGDARARSRARRSRRGSSAEMPIAWSESRPRDEGRG